MRARIRVCARRASLTSPGHGRVEVVNVLEEPYTDGADYKIVVRDGVIHGQLRPFRLLSLKIDILV